MTSPTRRSLLGGSMASFAAACASLPRGRSDILVHGGPIYTGSRAAPVVEAVRFGAGRVLFAGRLKEARGGPGGAREIDLAGAAAYPGLVDSHTHLPHLGLTSMQLDLTAAASLNDLQQRVRAYAQAHPQGPIVGGNWIESRWPDRRFPTRDDLDAAVADRPVYLPRADGHLAVVNSALLALMQVGAATPDPDGGRIERDSAGRPTGRLIDKAMALATQRLPEPTRAMKRQALKHAVDLYAAAGWTGVVNMSTTLENAALFDELAAAGELPLKVDLYIADEDADGFFARGPSTDPTGLVDRRGIKLYMDGALGSRGAALLAAYADAPGDGLLVTPIEHMRDLMRRARQARAQIATHAIGDRAVRLTLDLFEQAFADDPQALHSARWRIEHAQVVSASDMPRFGRTGVIASMQPSHAITDMYFAPARLGPERLAGAYAWRSLADAGAMICAGTDAPVGTFDPLTEFYAAIYRHTRDGFAGPDWHLEQVVGRAEALSMLTSAGAYATFQEASRGTLEPGRRADLSAFSVDLMQAPAPQIAAARAVLTVSNGRITHNAL